MSALETLTELRREVELFKREQVGRGLAAGRSFSDVARALGISRQAAHSRYRDLAPAHGPWVAVTEPARRVLRLAHEEALATLATLGGEHVLIAVLRCDGDAAQALVREGATLGRVRACARVPGRSRASAGSWRISAGPAQRASRGQALGDRTRGALARCRRSSAGGAG